MDGQLIELAYALDTFYFLVMGAFVMWMAAGFSMLRSWFSTLEKYCRNFNKKYSFVFNSINHVYVGWV